MKKGFVFLLPLLFTALQAACSLQAPHQGQNTLTITVDDHLAGRHNLAETLFDTMFMAGGGLGIFSGSTPSQTSDFSCYLANITGTNIPTSNQFSSQCSNFKSTDNMHGAGFGIISTVVGSGQSIQVDILAGTSRNIGIYGIYPPPSVCPGGPPDSSSGTNSAGYFLGSVTKDILTSDSVSVTTSYDGAAAQLTCNSPPSLNYLVPPGTSLSGNQSISVGGNGIHAGFTFAVADGAGSPVNCTGLTLMPAGNNNSFSCTLASGSYAAGTGSVTVTNTDGQSASMPLSFNSGPFMFWNDTNGAPPFFQNGSAYNYNNVVSSNTQSQTFQIFNLGGAATGAGTPTANVSGANSANFVVNANFSTTGYCGNFATGLAVGGSCTIQVDFTPNTAGPFNALVTMNFNGNIVTRSLIGTGI